MKKLLVWIGLILLLVPIGVSAQDLFSKEVRNANVLNKIKAWTSLNSNEVLVVAHRGDFKDAPESSELAITSAIAKGADVVEIDVRMTKDGQFVILHDPSLDRVSNGTGFVNEYTLRELKQLRLTSDGKITEYKILTLEEALQIIKGKILVNLDIKTGGIKEILNVCKRVGVVNQVVWKQQFYPGILKEPGVIFMPRVTSMEQLKDTLALMKPVVPTATEVIFPKATDPVGAEAIPLLKKMGSRIWANALWNGRESGGWGDEQAVQNPEVYMELIKNGVNIIQTDELELLINYLRSKNLHSGNIRPVLYGANIDPAKANAGDVKFQVKVLDPKREVKKVIAVLRATSWGGYLLTPNPYTNIELNDKGQGGDGIWTGTYNVDTLNAQIKAGAFKFRSFDIDFYAMNAQGYMIKRPGPYYDVPVTTAAKIEVPE